MLPDLSSFGRTNIAKSFGTPRNNKLYLIYNDLQECPEKVLKTEKNDYF